MTKIVTNSLRIDMAIDTADLMVVETVKKQMEIVRVVVVSMQ